MEGDQGLRPRDRGASLEEQEEVRRREEARRGIDGLFSLPPFFVSSFSF
jgi:hypothetical protein